MQAVAEVVARPQRAGAVPERPRKERFETPRGAGLNFTIPYLSNGEPHDYVPDFIVRLKIDPALHLILETKGYDPLKEVKAAAAHRWCAAVNADGRFGRWTYAMATDMGSVDGIIRAAVS